jgi:hypothetical protein
MTPGWQQRMERILDRYATDYFILETTGPRGELWRQLQPLVGKEIVHLDGQTVVLTAATVRRCTATIERDALHAQARP